VSLRALDNKVIRRASSSIHVVHLLQYPLCPLDGCRDHAVRPWTAPRVEQILGGSEMPRHENPRNDPDHPLASFVHPAMIPRLLGADSGPICGVERIRKLQARLTLDPEPILHEQLEPRDLILVQSTAVSDHVPNFELRQDGLHRLLTSQCIGEIAPILIEDADDTQPSVVTTSAETSYANKNNLFPTMNGRIIGF